MQESKDIITRYTGPFDQARFSLNGDGDNLQIAVVDSETGAVEVVFTGDKFSPEEYAAHGKKEEDEHLSHLRKS